MKQQKTNNEKAIRVSFVSATGMTIIALVVTIVMLILLINLTLSNNKISAKEKELTEIASTESSTYTVSTSPEKITRAGEDIWRFSYIGEVEEFVAPYTGKYYIETYGAAGGNANAIKGGTGGKTTGYYNLQQGEKLYICVGGKGTDKNGGYNGGGSPTSGAYGGGGATSVTTTNRGTLNNFENNKEEVIIVAGGGGGAGTNMYTANRYMPIIGCGGGLSGGISREYDWVTPPSWFVGATYLNGYAFGKGGPGENGGGSGGGGFYGGIGTRSSSAGGLGGAGYVNKDLYDTISQQSTNTENGSALIRYDGRVKVNLNINLYGKATIDGKSDKITISKYSGDLIELEPVCATGYKIHEYAVKYGDAKIEGNKIKVGFYNSTIDIIYNADLILTSTTFDGICKLSFKEDDNFNKNFRVYESLDGENWYFANADTENITKKTEIRQYSYTGGIQSFVAPYNTNYRLYLYGAQGGGSIAQGSTRNTGGTGGYTEGTKMLNSGDVLYICVGGAGSYGNLSGWAYGGYNGGGRGTNDGGGGGTASDDEASGGGGGATSITTTNRGELFQFYAHKNEVIAVAGGGGGGSYIYSGGIGGGLSGGSNGTGSIANQTTGYAFGKGQDGSGSADSDGVGGGGGGWYGGYTANVGGKSTGGGGSGYIGGMDYGRTIVSSHTGNGYAKIEYDTYSTTESSALHINIKDKEAPNKPSNGELIKEGKVVRWQDNGDNGSTYYHMVESFNSDNGSKLHTSNITEDYIISGVKGWYYYIDKNANGTVTKENSKFTEVNYTDIGKTTEKQYIHIATVDKEGNLSETYHFEIMPFSNYIVNHYIMNEDGETYYLQDSCISAEIIGVNIVAKTNYYEGFTTPQEKRGTVLPDNELVIEYYYTRNRSTLQVNPNGGTWNGSTIIQNYTQYYNTEKDISIPTRVGYNFKGWTKIGNNGTLSSNTYTFGTTNNVTDIITANWELITNDIIGSITWNDQENKYISRPSEVEITLNSDEEEIKKEEGALETPATKTVTSETYSFENLQTKNITNNKDYIYTVNQNKILGYETITNGYDIINNLILPTYTSQIITTPNNSETEFVKNEPVQIVGVITARDDNRNKVGLYREETKFEIDSGIQIDRDSIQITYIDKEENTKEITEYTVEGNIIKVAFESNREQDRTAGDSLKIELKGIMKEVKEYTNTITYSGYLRDYETGEDTNINLETLTTANETITVRKVSITFEEINEKNEITTGSQFEIRNKETGEVIQSFITEGEAEAIRKLEPLVEYVVVETKPIPGYTTAEEATFMLNEQGEIIIENGAEKEENTIILRDYKTKLQVEIIDELTKQYVIGPTWQIIKNTEENGQSKEEIITEWTSEGNEKQIEQLPIGRYTLREIEIGEDTGYVTIKDVKFIIEDTKELQILEVEQKVSRVRIYLRDIETEEYIEGAVLQIVKRTEKNGKIEEKIVREWTTELKGKLELKLPVGEYILKEKTPDGYKEAEDIEIKVENIRKLQVIKIKNRRLIYDMQVEKELTSITIDGERKLAPEGKIQKVEVQESKIKTADIKLEYAIRVSNVGETKATIGKIIDNIPRGLKLVSTDWKQEGKQAIYNAEKEELEPGKSKEVRIVLRWKNNSFNFGEKRNTAELKGSTNPYLYEDKNTDNDLGEKITIFSIKTGSSKNTIIKIISITIIVNIIISLIISIKIGIIKNRRF